MVSQRGGGRAAASRRRGERKSLLNVKLLSIRRKTFHPEEPHVDENAQELMVREILEECDVDHVGKISFDAFLPWYWPERE